jgi:hypothetical protein
MKKQSWFRRNIDLIQIAIGLVIVAVAVWDMIGKPARPALLLTLATASVGLGVLIGIYVEQRRAKRRGGEPGSH